MSKPDQYYNRYDGSQNYDSVMFRADRVLQSAELNEMQSMASSRLKGVADVLFKDGDVLRDAQVIVNAVSGLTRCESGAIYISGAVRGIAPATFTIPVSGLVAVGVYLREAVVTELEDPRLYNPAVGTRGEGEPGAARLKVEIFWGVDGDGQGGEFFPVYTIEDGCLRAKEAPPNLDAVSQALAKYDRDSAGGTYVVDGLTVQAAEDAADGKQVYTIAEGRARVNGYAVEMGTSRRLAYEPKPDLFLVDSEPHLSTTAGKQRIELDRSPLANIISVKVTKQKTVSLVHGSYSNAADDLPDSSVLAILKVEQNGTVFEDEQGNPSGYKLAAGKVDWSAPGPKPATGSTYSVTYQYWTSVTPTDVDAKGFSVEGAVQATQILITYNQYLPRIDRLCLSSEGELIWLRGVAASWNPRPPRVPGALLCLATVYQSWDKNRQIINDGVRMVPMWDIATLSERMDRAMALIAQQRLIADAQLREDGAKKSVFVDPFLDDDMRDQGIPQSARFLTAS